MSQPISAQPPEPTVADLAQAVARLTTRVEALEQALGKTQAAAVPAMPVAPTAAESTATAEPAPVAAVPVRPADPVAEIKGLLRSMFQVALATSSEDPAQIEANFEQFRDLVHHLRKGSPLLNQELLSYKWKPLVTRARLYLSDGADPASFTIVQMTPERVDARTETVRVFLRADKRMPPPVTLRRDDQADGAFRIETTSL